MAFSLLYKHSLSAPIYCKKQIACFNHRMVILVGETSLVPMLSPRASKKTKERGEPGKIYNVIGKDNLITCGRTKERAHALWTEYTRSVAIVFLWPIESD